MKVRASYKMQKKGTNPIALMVGGTVFPEDHDIFEVCDVTSTSAVKRLLKSETGKNYDIVRTEWDYSFYANDMEIRKLERLFKGKALLSNTSSLGI